MMEFLTGCLDYDKIILQIVLKESVASNVSFASEESGKTSIFRSNYTE